jgi:predicted nucleic acid-binding protein
MLLCNARIGDTGAWTLPRIFNPRFCNNHVDTNFFDRLGDGEDDAVDEILALYNEATLSLLMPHSVKAEIDHPNTPPEVKRRAADLVFSLGVQRTPQEEDRHRRVSAMLRGNAQPGKHYADACHVVEAEKYGGHHFLTRDKRLLAKHLWEARCSRLDRDVSSERPEELPEG